MAMLWNSFRWPSLARLAIYVCAVGVFLTGGHFAATYMIESQRTQQLEGFGSIALRRSETFVDTGLTTLRDFALGGHVGCDNRALQSLRLHVYRSGIMKDIRVLRPDGSVLCSAFPETLEFDKGWPSRDEMLTVNGSTARLFRVDQFYGTGLGVVIDVDSNHSLAGIMSVDGSLFDVLPAELVKRSVVSLQLKNGLRIASTNPGSTLSRSQNSQRVASPSERYPVQSVIRVENAAYEAWNRGPHMPIMAIAGLLGLAFAILLSRSILRARTPLDELDRAIAVGHIKPWLQPIFDLRSGDIVGAEILARWEKPDGTIVPPSRFIELAEESGRIQALTWELLSSALEATRDLMRENPKFTLGINISPSHFVRDGFTSQLRQTVARANVKPQQIVLELTERESFNDPEQAAIIVATVRGYGFKVAIDDVGIGHSGLSQIQRLRADILKIDKFFIDSVNREPAAVSMIGMLVRLAREMNMYVVAEGIEEREQIDSLIACGISKGQGYVVSPPMPATRFLTFLADRKPDPAPAVSDKNIVAA